MLYLHGNIFLKLKNKKYRDRNRRERHEFQTRASVDATSNGVLTLKIIIL